MGVGVEKTGVGEKTGGGWGKWVGMVSKTGVGVENGRWSSRTGGGVENGRWSSRTGSGDEKMGVGVENGCRCRKNGWWWYINGLGAKNGWGWPKTMEVQL
jgi:hypothetical protein